MNREEMLATIDAAYAARAADDVEALTRVLAPDATFEFAGEPGPLHSLPGSTGPEDSEPAIAALMRLISTSGVERLQAVIEGNRATTVSRVTLSFAGRPPFETLVCDLWEFDDAGRIKTFLEFADTARIAEEMRAIAG